MERTIVVKGIGRTTTKPDLTVLTMDLDATDFEYDRAIELASEQIGSLFEALMGAGFERSELKTTDFSIDTEYESYKDIRGNYQRKFVGYKVKHKLVLRFKMDMKKLSNAIGAMAKCKSMPEFSIAFTVEDPTAVCDELLRSAAENAKRKADILCESSGARLGKLLNINYNWTEINLYSETRYLAQETCEEASAPMDFSDIEPDDIRAADNATFTWEIAE